MENLIVLLLIVSMGITLQAHGVIHENANQTSREPHHQSKNRPGKRNTKFIIPALISHMYRQKLDDSPLSTMLNRPFAKRVGKQDGRKRESVDGTEHRNIVGNTKKEEHVRNVPKTKSPIVKTKESPVMIELQSKEEVSRNSSRYSDANIAREGSVIQVSKHFSPLSRHANWQANPPSMMWPPALPYPNSYGMPMEYTRFSRPMYRGNFGQQEGFIHHIMGPTRNKFVANNLQEEGLNKNLVAKERKFMVTNITKYVLDFYCPHCGGEISVSKNKNRGGLFGGEEGAISINKGLKDINNKQSSTTSAYPKEPKIQQMN